LNQNAFWILEQRAFDKQQRAVLFESMYQNDVSFLKRVTRTTPLQLLRQVTLKHDLSQLLIFLLPLAGLLEKPINLRIRPVHLMVLFNKNLPTTFSPELRRWHETSLAAAPLHLTLRSSHLVIATMTLSWAFQKKEPSGLLIRSAQMFRV
jgi:hypothetical protein